MRLNFLQCGGGEIDSVWLVKVGHWRPPVFYNSCSCATGWPRQCRIISVVENDPLSFSKEGMTKFAQDARCAEDYLMHQAYGVNLADARDEIILASVLKAIFPSAANPTR
jgi:hypothetical protein